MATDKPRHGYERKRPQPPTKIIGRPVWTKRDGSSGEFMSQKTTPKKIQKRPARKSPLSASLERTP
jgi:hypothetical protein